MIETEMKSKQTGIQSMERGVVSLAEMFPHTTGKFKSGILRVSRPVFLKIFTVVLLLWKVARLLTLSLQQRCQQ